MILALQGGAAARFFRPSPLVRILAHGTAKIAVLPSDPFPAPVGGGVGYGGPANFAARVHVTLRLPSLLFGPKDKVRRPTQPPGQGSCPRVEPRNLFRQRQRDRMPDAGDPCLGRRHGPDRDSGGKAAQIKISDLVRQPLDPPYLVERIDVDLVPDLLAELMARAAVPGIAKRDLNAALKAVGIAMVLERRLLRKPAVPADELAPNQ